MLCLNHLVDLVIESSNLNTDNLKIKIFHLVKLAELRFYLMNPFKIFVTFHQLSNLVDNIENVA